MAQEHQQEPEQLSVAVCFPELPVPGARVSGCHARTISWHRGSSFSAARKFNFYHLSSFIKLEKRHVRSNNG